MHWFFRRNLIYVRFSDWPILIELSMRLRVRDYNITREPGIIFRLAFCCEWSLNTAKLKDLNSIQPGVRDDDVCFTA
jgi:hypothetical protein